MSSSYSGKPLQSLPSPSFVVDVDAYRRNCDQMLDRARVSGINLRGQVKTHKTIEGGVIQTGGTKRWVHFEDVQRRRNILQQLSLNDARGLVTSTFPESEMYADAGFDDILYGYPLLETHMPRNYALAERLDRYHLMVTNMEAVDILLRFPPPETKKWSVFLKIDCGNARAGIWWKDEECMRIAKRMTEHPEQITLTGLYVHCSNSYKGKTVAEVEKVRDDTIEMLVELKSSMQQEGIEVSNIGIGSTPSCSHLGGSMKALTEIHPGNYVFYDVQQLLLNSCKEEDIAGRVLTRIIGHYPKRNQMLIDCGFLGLTMQGYQQLDSSFAFVQGHPDLKVSAMTQEIGFVEARDGKEIDFEKFPIGSIAYLLPFHSCATAACYSTYYVHKDGIVQEEWKPCKFW